MGDERHVLVIGAGTAGTRVARTVASAGVRVTVVESGDLGGTCVWRGCVPKKALYSAAQIRREAGEAGRMGFAGLAQIARDPLSLNWARLMAWKGEVQRTYAGDQEGILADLGVRLIHGPARFVSPDEVHCGAQTLRPSHVVIATGSRAVKPRLPGFELADTSDEALSYRQRPESLAIVGGGYIALELAGIYAAFGTRVTVMVRGAQLLRAFDPEAAALARQGLERLGVTVLMNTAVRAIEGGPGELTLHLIDAEKGEREFACERVLAATGRTPDLADLGLAAGGVEVDDRGRLVLDASLHSMSNPRVWAAGDAAGGVALTPAAGLEGEYVAQSILSGEPHPVDLSGLPSTCFTVPEVARVGLGEATLAARGAPYLVARGNYQWVAQAIIGDRRDGLVKLLAGADGRLLGAHLAGPHAGDLIYTLSVAWRAAASLDDLQASRAVHPTLSEALNWASFAVEVVRP
jgi:glutathione reductase (NADPH)